MGIKTIQTQAKRGYHGSKVASGVLLLAMLVVFQNCSGSRDAVDTARATGGSPSTNAQQYELLAIPTEGNAPLLVTFSGASITYDYESVMELDFGDGQSDNSHTPIQNFSITHVYQSPGIYQVQLKEGPYGGPNPTHLSVIATAVITVH